MKQKEIFLCKYGEIVLKGANRKYFEDMLCREMKKKARAYGNFDIYRAQSTIYIEPKDDEADVDGMFEAASKVFGIVAISRAAVCEKNMESIIELVKIYLPDKLFGVRSFKVEAKRSDKKFPYDSPKICLLLGERLLDEYTRNSMLEKILSKIDSKSFKAMEFINTDVKKGRRPKQMRKLNDLFQVTPLLILEIIVLAIMCGSPSSAITSSSERPLAKRVLLAYVPSGDA